ncbi:Glycerophosphocholine phosphodiesterase GPCPD1-like 1 [Homarus americanus]|uniref:Glycerophosphocholine phosphodiesterase GPCPD1-like 1 n=1 Tax=Homarus americanus TaxID=6706 RepID=A0A8J5K6J2_HOMAM|nr:Glycerophosphocholine phosphodiesterase GPCPD1-like 1 [Homarus americanus]
MIESREWVFRVTCQVAPEEQVCVVGNCDSLGMWDSQRMVPLYPEDSVDSEEVIWSTPIQIPFVGVEYRYCVCIILEAKPGLYDRTMVVRRWETNLWPRKVPDGENSVDEPQVDRFGSFGGFERVDQGWLVKESVVQLFDSVMKEGLCKFLPQEQFGVVCNNGDYTIFQCQMLKPQTIVFLLDFYIEGSSEEIPKHLGCSYILPSNLKENYGVATLPITSPKHIPVGQLTVHYMVVNPLEYGGDMSVSYARHWKDSWKGLEVGHRGAGNSYHSEPKSCANIRENTVASLKYAAEKGADMVEFDVQLSKDLVPVIYHDFHACIALKRKKEQDKTDLLEIPIKDLTLSQLQALKVCRDRETGACVATIRWSRGVPVRWVMCSSEVGDV